MYINQKLAKVLKVDDPLSLTKDDFFRLINSAIEPELPHLARVGEDPIEIMPNIDYGRAPVMTLWEKLSDIKDIESAEVEAIPSLGGNEGCYIAVNLVIREYGMEDRRVPVLTYKTLGDGFEDCCLMGTLAGALSYAVELFLWLNVW